MAAAVTGGLSSEAAGGDARLGAWIAGHPIEVPAAAIERELASLWRSAAGARTTVTRACLWTLVVRVPGDALPRARRLVDALAPLVPARTVVLATRPGAPEAPLRSTVEANWHAAGGGATQIGSEEITIEASGAAERHLPPIARALRLPDVPSAALWLGAPPDADDALDGELRAATDRLVLDGDGATTASGAGPGLVALARFVCERHEHCEAADLAWLRSAPARVLLASLFDPPAPPGEAFTVERARIAYRPDRAATAFLLAGWLASRLGWTEGRASTGGDTLHYRAASGRPVTVALRKDTRAAEPVGGVELFASGGRYAVSFLGAAVVLETPGLAWKDPFTPRPDAALWAAALGAAGRDPLYVKALEEIAPVARSG